MKKLLLFATLLVWIICGSVNATVFSGSALFDIIKIERTSQPQTFILSITDKLFDLPSGGSFSYYDLMYSYDFVLTDCETRDAFTPLESVLTNYECIQWIAGEYDRLLAWNWNVNLPTFVDIRAEIYTGYPSVQGIKIGTLNKLPANIPLFSFKYTGNSEYFTVFDEQLVTSGQIVIPASTDPGIPSQVPTAVPEPATLLGLGVPMLMVGISKIRQLRK